MDVFWARCLVLMIEITATGGFGGLATGGTTTTSVQLDALPAAEAAAVCEAFKPARLAAIAEAPGSLGRADTLTYDIVVTDHQGPQRFQLDEAQLPPETLDLIDTLIHGRE